MNPCAADLYALGFPEQQAFIRDPARKKSLICPRRAGKSKACAIYMILVCMLFPGCRCVYIGLTRGTAKEIMWEMLQQTANAAGIVFTKNETELSLTFGNGSRLRLIGLDAGRDEMKKTLGGKVKLALLDEAASFRVDLKALIKEHLTQSLMDDRGTLAMVGTPDPDEARGFFYEVTTGRVDGWSRHTWSTAQNPYMATQYAEEIATIAAEDPLYVETDGYRCMYLGEWPRDHKGRVYQATRERNLIAAEPAGIVYRIIAIDLGWTDPSAIVELGWRLNDPVLYVLHAESSPHMEINEIAARVQAIAERKRDPADYVRFVVDGANQQVVQELRRRYGLPLADAEKVEKVAHIGMMNADIVRGRVQLVAPSTQPLLHEWTGADEKGIAIKSDSARDAVPLVWDARAANAKPPRRVEDPRCANHCSDAALYGWRTARAYREMEPGPKPTADEAMTMMLAEKRRKKLREIERRQGGRVWP